MENGSEGTANETTLRETTSKVNSKAEGNEFVEGHSNCPVTVEANLVLDLQKCVNCWSNRLQHSTKLVGKKSSSREPYKFIYQGIEDTKLLRKEIQDCFTSSANSNDATICFWIKFTLIHVYSSLAKWNEACDQLANADEEHKLCINLIEQLLESEDSLSKDRNPEAELTEIEYGFNRCRYMLIYELTRYAVLCSERDNQMMALDLLKRAEEFYHTKCGKDHLDIANNSWTLLSKLDSLNSEKSADMFLYVLFYLGQAYRITGDKEKAALYLHMVLRKQLENGSISIITWSTDTVKMAMAVLVNVQSFDACKTLLLAATTVLNNASAEEKLADEFKQAWADLGRSWLKLGLEVLEMSCDRLKDLEDQSRKPPKFLDTLKFTSFERLSLELKLEDEEYDTLLLIRSLNFPSLDVDEILKNEMPVRYVRDFDEARAVFLPLQKWFRISKEYYVIDEYAGDYIELVSDYSTSFKYLVFFEFDIQRQIKMQTRRINILEELLKLLSPVAYHDVFHSTLKDLAEIYESVYKLKVEKARERGESLRPKDNKLVKLLVAAIGAHRRNLEIFHFNLNDAEKDFPEGYEKVLLGTVLSVGRILGTISHDHPMHPDAVKFAEDGKSYYKYFLKYLDHHLALKSDFKVLYDGTVDLPELLDAQIDRIKHTLRVMTIE